MRRLLRAAMAAGFGAVTALSLPPWGLWALGPIGLGLWLRFFYRGKQRWHRRLATAAAFWGGAYLVGLAWITDLTVPGWIAAVVVETLIMALAMSLVRADPRRSLYAVPAALVLGEAVRWRLPFGGVPMSNLALGQVDGLWLAAAPLAGALGIIALVGIAAVATERLLSFRWLALIWPLVITSLVPAITPWFANTNVERTITAAVVQAGGELGTRSERRSERPGDAPQRPVLVRHVDAVADWPAGADLMVWSESSASADAPLEQSPQLALMESLAAERDLVLVANFYERTPRDQDGDGRFYNATVAVSPTSGLIDRYDKAHLVPFGEYVPLRSLAEPFADLSLIDREAIAGEGLGLLTTPLGDLAVATSYEVYFGSLVREGVQAGGAIIVNPTLASSYTTSVVPGQSLASARLRAAETGRWVLQSSTTGYSAIVDSDGNVTHRSELREAVVLEGRAELRAGDTPATVFGPWPIIVAAAAIVALHAARPRRSKD